MGRGLGGGGGEGEIHKEREDQMERQESGTEADGILPMVSATLSERVVFMTVLVPRTASLACPLQAERLRHYCHLTWSRRHGVSSHELDSLGP